MTAMGEPLHGDTALAHDLVNEVDEQALARAVRRRVGALLADVPRVHTEIRSMLRSAADLSEEQAYDLSADKLMLGSLRRRMA
jgi:methylglutaconyl-CoA hydratase